MCIHRLPVIPDQGTTQIGFYADRNKAEQKNIASQASGSFVYGMTDYLSISVNAPYFLKNAADEDIDSRGWGDASLELEYAPYQGQTSTYTSQWTVLANATFPTGSSNKIPATGYGGPSYTLGSTFSQTYVNWYWYISPGSTITTSRHRYKPGNTYFVQAGFSQNLHTTPEILAIDVMVELAGEKVDKDKVMGIFDNDTGGRQFLITPSLWVSTDNILWQLGLSLPLKQDLNGDQPKSDYTMMFSFTLTL